MGLRIHKRIRIFPGLYLNIGAKGISFSFGIPGLRTTVGKKGITHSIGIPGTGISYRTKAKKWGSK